MTTTNETTSGLVREVFQNVLDGNNVLTAIKVAPVFQGHYFENDNLSRQGWLALITAILTDASAVFPLGAETTEFRPVVVKAALTVSQIEAEVQARFSAGSTRYGLQSLKQYLSVYMPKAGMVAKFQLTSAEDASRTCAKPHSKYYLVQK
jgi:hypothetical protein